MEAWAERRKDRDTEGRMECRNEGWKHKRTDVRTEGQMERWREEQ